MKRVFALIPVLALAAVLFVPGLAGAEQSRGEAVKSAVEGVVSDVVNVGKEAASAGKQVFRSGKETAVEMVDSVGEGVRAGLGKPTPDAPRLVRNKEELAAMAKVSVERSEKMGDGSYRITIAVRNNNDFPIRLTMLSNQQNVILLDKKGFAYPLPEPVRQGGEVVVYPKSSSRAAYTFTGVTAKPRYLRLYGTDFKI